MLSEDYIKANQVIADCLHNVHIKKLPLDIQRDFHRSMVLNCVRSLCVLGGSNEAVAVLQEALSVVRQDKGI